MPNTSLIIADDHKVFRQGLRYLIEQQPDLTILHEASSGTEVLELLRNHQPDILLLDISLSDMSGFTVIEEAQLQHSPIKTIIISMHSDPLYAIKALRAGAFGYVTKNCGFSEILDAILSVQKDKHYISTEIADQVFQALLTKNAASTSENSLSPREQEVLRLIAEGNSNANMAEKMKLSIRTVESHRARLMTKLNIHSPIELVRYAIRQGVAAPKAGN